MKPDEGSQGDGIYLITDPKDYVLSIHRRHVVQEYLADPFLLEDLKFDFRLYVLIASLEPLQVTRVRIYQRQISCEIRNPCTEGPIFNKI